MQVEEAERPPRRKGQLGASPPDKSGLSTINRLLRVGNVSLSWMAIGHNKSVPAGFLSSLR
jgi:hypothetical protein